MSSALNVAVTVLSGVAGLASAAAVILTSRVLRARHRDDQQDLSRIVELTARARSVALIAVDKHGTNVTIAKRPGPISHAEAEEIQRGVHAGGLHSV